IPYPVESEPRNTFVSAEVLAPSSDRLLHLVQLLWTERRFLQRFALSAAALTMLVSLFLTNTYRATTRLMPPEDQSGSKATLAMLAGMASKTVGVDISQLAGDLLGAHNTGAMYLGILYSHTAQENIVDKF